MARYRMTARRARALQKAQRISAQKRRKRFGFAAGRKLSQGHKRAIGVAVAGATVAVYTDSVIETQAIIGAWEEIMHAISEKVNEIILREINAE